MPQTRIFYVGTQELASPHASSLQRAMNGAREVRILPPAQAEHEATPDDICIFYNECQPDIRHAVETLVQRGCPTLLAPDGILEWRSAWEDGSPEGWMRPVIAHKVACLGRAQARALAAWGNAEKCEIVGTARFDALLNRKPRERKPGEPFRLLAMTAKNPGFNAAQRSVTEASLRALQEWLAGHTHIEGTSLEVTWRIAPGMAADIGVPNELRDTTGADLAATLQTVDAVLTTPSTAQLEAMLQGIPVAVLDFHNVPQYCPGAWTISATSHFDLIIPQLINPAPEKLAFQNALLRDQLESTSPAGPRLISLLDAMQERARDCCSRGEALSFPPNMLGTTFETGTEITGGGELDHLKITAIKQERTIADLKHRTGELQLENDGLQSRLARYEGHVILGGIARLRRRLKGAAP